MNDGFEKKLFGNDSETDNTNNNYKGNLNDDFENDKNSNEGKKEGGEVLGRQEKAAFKKEESASCQEKANEQKIENCEGKIQESKANIKAESTAYTYSASYYPPDFISVGKKNRGRKRFSAGFVAAVAAICVVLSLVCGAFSGFMASMYLADNTRLSESTTAEDAAQSKTPSEDDNTVTVNKNNSPTKVDQVIENKEEDTMTVVEVVDSVAASVVEVTTITTSNYGQYVSGGAGSGVIIAQGNGYAYIVTNYHVVDGSDYIAVRLTDRSEYVAEYIDGDEYNDIAIIRISETRELCVAKIGSSDALRVGEGVVAIGNPLGELGGTVTDGIVSALDREITIDGVTMTLLQTNAAINPGNSGGGLFNMAGRLVGIVNAKHLKSGIEGLGFAIPIDHIYEDLIEIIEDGYIHGRVTIGIDVIYLDRMSARYYFGIGNEGVYIISSDSEDFKVGDRIVNIAGTAITSEVKYMNVVTALEIGKDVEIDIVRGNTAYSVTVAVREYIPESITVKE